MAFEPGAICEPGEAKSPLDTFTGILSGEVNIFPQIVTAFIQYWMAKKMLEAQKDARERLSALAFENMELAEELFAAHMELRAYDTQVYDYVKSLPSYEICQEHIDRGKMTGHFKHFEVLKRGVFGHSRYNCGNREEAISAALSVGLIHAGERMADAYRFEELTQDLYDTLRWTSITTSAAFSEFNPASVFGSVGQQAQDAHQAYTLAANGSLAALGYTATGLVRDISNNFRSQQGAIQLNDRGDATSSRYFYR